MLNFFEDSCVCEIIESWLVYASKFSWIARSYFLTETEKLFGLHCSYKKLQEKKWGEFKSDQKYFA